MMLIVIFCINFDFILCNSDFDFILYYNLLLCFIPLEMHVHLICAIKFYLLTYLLRPNSLVSVTACIVILTQTVLSSDSVAVFKLTLMTFLFSWAFSSFSAHFLCSLTRCLAPAPLKLRPYGAIQICLLLLLLL